VTWSYDNLYQLTRERRSGANSYDITYSYDTVGNRRTKLENAITTTYIYDAANELRTLKDNTGTTTYAFDANGNRRTVKAPSGGITTYVWDYENKLTKAVLGSGTINTFSYDADGRRTKKEDSGGASKFLWDLENILLDADSSDVTQVVYTLQPVLYGNLLSQIRSGSTSYFQFDALGSTDRLTNSIGTVTDSYLYEAFGNVKATSGTTTNGFKYVGRLGYYLDLDLVKYYMRARYFDPVTGGFLSRDPLDSYQIKITTYSYAGNNSVNTIDPSGQVPWPVIVWLLTHAIWYGNYCGPGSTLPGPGPIDGLDACCQAHDNCYAAAGAPWWRSLPGYGTPATILCDAALCACAKAFACAAVPPLRRPHCYAYRLELIAFFC
jgi:RHS repeat-associated protein